MQVLFVEDDRESADAFAALATAMGHAAHVAYDGNSALRLVTAQRFDAIFLDFALPDSTGAEICRQIRAATKSDQACVFAVTGSADLSDEELTPFDGYLVKPLTVDALEQALQAADD